MGQWGIHRLNISRDLLAGFFIVHDVVSRVCLSVMPSKNPICCSLSLFLPPSFSSQLSTLDGAREKWASLGASCAAGKHSTPSYALTFPCIRNQG